MTRLNQTDTRNLESKIQELKNSLTGISEERWRAALSKDEKALVRARIKASEVTLENCDAIARYLQHFSPPLSKEIRARGQSATIALDQIKRMSNPQEFQKWVKNDLIPATKMSERLAHLAASSLRKAQGEDLEFHRWSGITRSPKY